ncbi:MAG TPA: MotA/TolQ/ExbB proton channel family protein [Phycisphaerales bacterium]|nr:MotA/TolQ/ExbB proton channel family protein [Phycisphaerales bacterium]
MDAKPRSIQLCVLALLGTASSTWAEGGGNSFAEAFFVSRRSDGSIELLGSGVTWLLLVMSVCGIGLIIHLSLANRRSSVLPDELVKDIRRNIKKKKFQTAIDLASKDNSYLGRILVAAFLEAKFGFPSMMRALEQTAEELATSRMRRIELLNVIGQVSPMIGLFGTVYGMILAFGAIVAAGGSADPVALAGGIGTALTTTFWGLVVAIPALAGYAIIRNKIDELTIEATIAAEEILNNFRPRPPRKNSQIVGTKKTEPRGGAAPTRSSQTVEVS